MLRDFLSGSTNQDRLLNDYGGLDLRYWEVRECDFKIKKG